MYLEYYVNNAVFPGGTSLDYALVGGLNFSMAMLMAPLVTVLTRKKGIHAPMLLGIFLQTLGLITASFAKQVWQLYLTQGVLVGLGVGWTYIPSIAILSQWFHKRRSLANGISAAGSGIGGLLFSFATRAMIDGLSLAWSLRIIGIVSGVMNLLATVLIRSRNKHIQPKQHGFDTKLPRRYDVMLLLAWGFVSMLGYMVLLFSLSDFARSIGLDDKQAASVTAFLNLGTALGRPFIGVLSDRFGRIETAGVITLLCALSVFAIWLPANSYGVSIFYAIVNGGILGVFWVVGCSKLLHGANTNSGQTIGPLSAELVGLVELPSLLSLNWLVIVLPTTCKSLLF